LFLIRISDRIRHMNKDNLKMAFNHLPIPSFRYYQETDSTNTQALDWISENTSEYSLVIAESQTAGRGRSGRNWVTTPGSSLAVSIILYPTKHEISKLGLFSLLGGLSVCKVIEDSFNIDAHVKWPNDVLIKNKKTAGILTESTWQGERLQGIVLGIGINLLTPSIPPSEEILFPATCIQSHTSDDIDVLTILVKLVGKLIGFRSTMLSPSFIQQYEKKLAYKNQLVTLDVGDETLISGHLKGIDPFGNIRLQLADNEERYFPIGDIKLRPQ
jgi:BirA family transcriptional regulator, biotin operon repressor / biotin---[acetyl-CoA-carboxylase] ligase